MYTDSACSYDIFKYARMSLDPGVGYTRYDTPRAALQLFARHSSQFRQFLVDDYKVCMLAATVKPVK
jgi:hypothetical protein